MHLIILAAGRGTRLSPITDSIPKPLIKINTKSILEFNLEQCYRYVKEITIIVKYKKEEIIKTFGDNYKGVKINYHTQGKDKGTGAALRGIDLNSNGNIMILYGDQIITNEDTRILFGHKGYAVLCKRVDNPEKYGVLKVGKSGFIDSVIEKPKDFIGNLASLGTCIVNSDFLKWAKDLKISERGEYEATDLLNKFFKEEKVKPIELKYELIDISYPEDIKKAEIFMKNNFSLYI